MIIMRVIMLLFCSKLYADQSVAHKQGVEFAQAKQGEVSHKAQTTNAALVPGFTTNAASLEEGAIGEATLNAKSQDKAYQYIVQQQKDRKLYKIDGATDPMVLKSNQAVLAPQKTLEEKIEAIQAEGEHAHATVKTCEEAGEMREKSCFKTLKVTLKITPGYKTASWSCRGFPCHICHRSGCEGSSLNDTCYHSSSNSDCIGCRWNYQETIVPEKVELLQEEWQDDCVSLENLVEQGLCQYVAKVCVVAGTQMVENRPIVKECWQYKQTYHCLPQVKNDCEALKALGCYQINSECIEWQEQRCILWQQTYRCDQGRKGSRKYRTFNLKSPFCLTGNCVDSSYEKNQELMTAMSQMSVLKQVQDDLRNGGVIFKGTQKACTRHCINFKDCCGVGKGWGIAFNLASCDGEEKQLADLRARKLCLQVGTYCAEKVLGICIRKKTSFCCFGSRLSRILQEQGRGQLGINWGEAEHPNCRGLTAEELSRLDLSKMNLSELFTDIQNNLKIPDSKSFSNVVEKVQNNISNQTVKSLKAGAL